MDLNRCGLVVEQASEVATLYRQSGNWNEVKEQWFEHRHATRSTSDGAQDMYRVLSERFKEASTSLPNPTQVPSILEACETHRDKAQILYFYLATTDALVQYLVHEYGRRLLQEGVKSLDFSDEVIIDLLNDLVYDDGTTYDYAESTTERWCQGFRSVMREIGVLEGPTDVVGSPPSLGDIPLLVALGFSYDHGDAEWYRSPRGLLYLFQPENRWEELYDRVATMDAWEYIELHDGLRLQPVEEPYGWVNSRGQNG